MNRVKRAIIMAAGSGIRLHPLTLAVPKPLIRVNGARMLDTILDALRKNGIEEIYIVVGYMAEAFRPLAEEYPGVTLLFNPYYDRCNNIASLYVAREYLENAIVLDGDQMVYNSKALSPAFERSGYNCVWTEEETDEWLLTAGPDGIVTQCSRTGGKKGWQLYSVSRWDAEDGRKLRRHLEIEFEQKKNWQIYWDDVPLFCYPEEYRLGIRPMNRGDVVEIDSLRQLAEADESYGKYLNGERENG